MKVDVQAVNFDVDKKLVAFINERLTKVEKFYDQIVSAEVFLKVENTSDKENKIAEVKLNIPGNDLIVKKITKSFEESVDTAAISLERMLIKTKEKLQGL